MENIISQDRWFYSMDVVLWGTLAHWWESSHMNIKEWVQVVELIKVIFHPIFEFELTNRYKGIEYP